MEHQFDDCMIELDRSGEISPSLRTLQAVSFLVHPRLHTCTADASHLHSTSLDVMSMQIFVRTHTHTHAIK
jgi:hypothetical protein